MNSFDQYAADMKAHTDEMKSSFAMPTFKLTPKEASLLGTLPDDVLSAVEETLSRVDPGGEDVRKRVVLKALAMLMGQLPEWERWAQRGYKAAEDLHA